uniref:(California timema) hypothetical protein n=1 Tax=Timema californicum TaxID=61474 RepID=A0A7R9J0N9_TIMCA|nr:unnamed protein product [Timema californicum]
MPSLRVFQDIFICMALSQSSISTIISPHSPPDHPHYLVSALHFKNTAYEALSAMTSPRHLEDDLDRRMQFCEVLQYTDKLRKIIWPDETVEDDGSAVVSLAGTDVGWTRVSQAGVGTGHSPPTPAGSSDENLSALLNAPISRSVPAPFQKEVLARCFVTSRPQDGNFIEEILNDGISEERLVYILGQSLPRIIPNVILNKREELLPLIISTIHLHPEASERDKLLHLLFNLKKRPHEEERRMILTGIVGIARCSGLSLVENEILPQCWEQISHKHLERRLLVAESCSALAPYVSSSIRNSLMLSMLQQMLLEDKDEMVREVVVRSLALIVTFMDDKDKYYQINSSCCPLLTLPPFSSITLPSNFEPGAANPCEELSMTALDDPSPSVVGSATRILLPVLAKWSLELDRLQASLITHLIQRLKSQTKPSPVESPGKQGLDSDQQMAWTLTVIQTLLPYLVMSVVAVEPVLSTITSDTTIVEPSEVFDLNNGLTNPAIFYEGEYPVSLILGAFDSYVDKEWQEGWPQMDWITSTFLPVHFLVHTHISLEGWLENLSPQRVFCSSDNQKVKPVFAERLQILEKSLTDSRSSIWPSLTIIPVYLVGILAARRDQEFTDELEGLLKRFVCALPVCGAPIHTLEVTIRCLCENTALHETVLAALWEGVVHPRAPVRSSAAILFVSVIGHVSEVLVASRIAPALVTLASDPDILAHIRRDTDKSTAQVAVNTSADVTVAKQQLSIAQIELLGDYLCRANYTISHPSHQVLQQLGSIVYVSYHQVQAGHGNRLPERKWGWKVKREKYQAVLITLPQHWNIRSILYGAIVKLVVKGIAIAEKVVFIAKQFVVHVLVSLAPIDWRMTLMMTSTRSNDDSHDELESFDIQEEKVSLPDPINPNSVRTSTIPAFGSLITNTTMKEVQDKTYMQLQSFLSDPSTRDNHTMLVQLVVTMGHIVSSCETWFREEVILPQLAAMSAYTLQSSNQTRRLDLAVALIEAFSSAVYCSLSKQTISTVLLPGLRYLEPITSQFLLAHHDTVMAMIKGAESRVEPHQPIESLVQLRDMEHGEEDLGETEGL